MRAQLSLCLAAALAFPAMSWAGGDLPSPVGVPLLGEASLIGIGVALLGIGGLSLLRRRKR